VKQRPPAVECADPCVTADCQTHAGEASPPTNGTSPAPAPPSPDAEECNTMRLELRRTLAKIRDQSAQPLEDSRVFRLRGKATRLAQDAVERASWLEEDG